MNYLGKTRTKSRGDRPSSASGAKMAGSKTTKKLPTTYKDYQVKQEASKSKTGTTASSKMIGKKPALNVMSEFRGVGLNRPKTAKNSHKDAQEFKSAVQVKFQNFVIARERGQIDEEDSLLEDSQADATRDQKKQALEMQKEKRRLERLEKKRREALEEKKRANNIDALKLRFKSQMKTFQKTREQNQRLKEKEDKINKKHISEIVRLHQPTTSTNSKPSNATEQLSDLRRWIEEQMKATNIDKSSHETSKEEAPEGVKAIPAVSATKANKSKSRDKDNSVSQLSNLDMDEVAISKEQKTKLLKHKLPGNNLLPEKEEQKLARKNRYGVFETAQPNEFDRVVNIQKEKATKEKASTVNYTSEQQVKVKTTLNTHLNDLVARAVVDIKAQRPNMKSTVNPKEEPEEEKDDLKEDSTDKVPVKEAKPTRTIVNHPASSKKRPEVKSLPGVMNTQKHYKTHAEILREKDWKAALVVQKFYRGFKGRREAALVRHTRRHDIEAEYGQFMQDVKFNREYNMQRFIKDKKKLREKNQIVESIEDIAEAIGETSMSFDKPANKKTVAPKVQNFFTSSNSTASSDNDPNSLIGIWARRNGTVPKEPKKTSGLVSLGGKISGHRRKQSGGKKVNITESIEEDIYSESFESAAQESISEELPKMSGSSFGQNTRSTSGTQSKTRATSKQKPVVVIESDSIIDEVDSLIHSRVSEEDIPMESHLLGGSAAKKSMTDDSIAEDSIIREEYDTDNFGSYNASQSALARNKVRFGINDKGDTSLGKQSQQRRAEAISQVQDYKEMSAVNKKDSVQTMLKSMHEYEAASMGNELVSRMEKVLVSSLAQKDQIIMAQRLSELEAEKRHKDEINRIREEQIKLMAQLMLLGGGGGPPAAPGAGAVAISEAQRAETLSLIKAIVDKPIEIKREEIHVNYEIPPDMKYHGEPPKMTYLQEYDISQGKAPVPLDPAQSAKISSMIEEDFNLISQGGISTSKVSKKGKAYGEDSISEDIPSAVESVEESIAESIEGEVTPIKKPTTVVSKPKVPSQKAKGLAHRKEVGAVAQGDQAPKLESDDDDDVKEALYQAHLMKEGIIGASPDSRHLMKKKNAAEWLMNEKEKAIQEQLKAKIEKLQGDEADQVLKAALDFNIEDEVEKRFAAARKQMEESVDINQSSRSILTTSNNLVDKPKKNVKWASPKNQKAQPARQQSPDKFSSTHKSDSNIDESIGESIAIDESIAKSVVSAPTSSMSKSASMKQKPGQPLIITSKSKPQPVVSEMDSVSEIESDVYEDDFEQSLKSQSNLGSKSALQQKAIDLGESNAYSDDFEESLAESASQKKLAEVAPAANKSGVPEVVEEESIDESIASPYAGESEEDRARVSASESKSKVEDSLDSSDQEVVASARSIEWQFNLQQDLVGSAKPSVAKDTDGGYSEDFIGDEEPDEEVDELRQESSDINERISEEEEEAEEEVEEEQEEEYSELVSCPDQLAGSGSMSAQEGNLALQADQITEELLQLILNDYKTKESELSFNVDKVTIDEEDFKQVWPWTLDKQPEPKASPKPAGVKVGVVTPKKEKTAQEIEDEQFKKKHALNTKKLAEEQQKAREFLDFMCSRVDLNKLIESLDKPIDQDPLKILAQIQAYEDEEPTQFEDSSVLAQQQILDQPFFNKTDREFVITQRMKYNKLSAAEVENSDILTMSQEDQENIQNVHHYALFESLNEALDAERPYKSKGEPMPWSKNTRTVRQVTTRQQAMVILDKAKQKVMEWNLTSAGSKQAPLPNNPPQQDEYGDDIVQPPLAEGEEERRNLHRQEKLSALMIKDIQENEDLWIDNEIEETQTRFDLADMILAHLADEVAVFLKEKGKL